MPCLVVYLTQVLFMLLVPHLFIACVPERLWNGLQLNVIAQAVHAYITYNSKTDQQKMHTSTSLPKHASCWEMLLGYFGLRCSIRPRCGRVWLMDSPDSTGTGAPIGYSCSVLTCAVALLAPWLERFVAWPEPEQLAAEEAAGLWVPLKRLGCWPRHPHRCPACPDHHHHRSWWEPAVGPVSSGSTFVCRQAGANRRSNLETGRCENHSDDMMWPHLTWDGRPGLHRSIVLSMGLILHGGPAHAGRLSDRLAASLCCWQGAAHTLFLRQVL